MTAHETVNPFRPTRVRAGSACLARDGERVVGVDTGTDPDDRFLAVHSAFRTHVQSDSFACLAGRAALQRATFRHGIYGAMASPESTVWLCADLFDFVCIQRGFRGEFSTFVASFLGPVPRDEGEFDTLVWDQLGLIHAQDRVFHRWDPDFSNDPSERRFGFSVAGRAFFIVGLSPVSSRISRRFAWPSLVFNAEFLFDRLHDTGKLAKLQSAIRERDMGIQGSINPNLEGEDTVSRARQYSGLPVPLDWTCPITLERR